MKTKQFKPVADVFGGTDEQATQDAFVEFVGGTHRAEQLCRLHRDSFPRAGRFAGQSISRNDVFKVVAARKGFTQQEIAAFLSL